MRNFPIDRLLKIFTVCSFTAVFGVCIYSVGSVVGASNTAIRDTSMDKRETAPSITQSPQPSQETNSIQTGTPTSEPKVEERSPTASPDARCIITVDSASYDVTQFKLIHDGGDIFICGGDMTSEFYKQHESKTLGKMERYKL